MKKVSVLFSGLLFLLITGCSTDDITKVACIGDSITYGSGIKNRVHNSYPAQLDSIFGISYDVRNYGIGGRTMLKHGDYPYWDEEIYRCAREFNPDIVIIKLGTNDSKPWNWKYSDKFEQDYRKMISDFQSLSSAPEILLCYPVPVFETKWGISDSVVVYGVIPAIDNLAAEFDLKIIDLYEPFVDNENLFPDKIHPDAEGARQMAEIIANAIEHSYAK
jgi:lysophospholipase L1-like esterase